MLSLSSFTKAESRPRIEFFASNNTHTINAEKAYQRLNGEAQFELENTMILILQKNHIEQGRFENILGVYNRSADNTKVFYTSPEQSFSNKQLFSLAKQLADALHQESIAVFIPLKDSSISDITVTFNHKLSAQEIIKLIHEKLPQHYSSAFSLHLTKNQCGLNQTKVSSIEWLGSKINIDEIKKAFPQQNITYQLGKSYLIYKNGQAKLL